MLGTRDNEINKERYSLSLSLVQCSQSLPRVKNPLSKETGPCMYSINTY